MFSENLINLARDLLETCQQAGCKIVTAESCTGGLIAALFTEIPGSSDVFERGFVTYSNAAKIAHLNVNAATLENYGAVSEHTALEMATGALAASHAELSVAVTGIAGPGGGTAHKPVGLIYIAVARQDNALICKDYNFGDIGRSQIRLATVKESLEFLGEVV